MEKNYRRFQYTEEALLTALEEIRQKRRSLNQASKFYGIPKGTLHNKLKDKVPIIRRMGPESTLSAMEEKRVVDWILNKAKLGFPMNPEDVKDSVQRILKAAKRQNPFTDDRPGKKWMQLFLRRHPEVIKCRSELLSKSRASVTEQMIRQWFDDVLMYCTEEQCLDVLECGKRIFNSDETGVQCCPKSGVLLGPKQYKNLYDIAAGNEKESITVLTTFSADGDVAPPMIVFPFKRIPAHITHDIPENWGVGRSDSGWMVSAVFYEYMANVFYPWLLEHEVEFPVIFFLDGHKSHISMELSEFCADKRILLYCLPPNATHILQPCDTTIFRPLKNAWKKEVRVHKQQTSKSVTKAVFPKLFKKAFDAAIKSETIKNGFRSCGLFPFNPNAVDYNKCISKRREDIQREHNPEEELNDNRPTTEEYMIAKKVIEYEMGTQKIEVFKNELKNNTLSISLDDMNLFEIWKVCDLKNNALSDSNGEQCDSESAHNTSLPGIDIDTMPIEIDGIVFDAVEFDNFIDINENKENNDKNESFSVSMRLDEVQYQEKDEENGSLSESMKLNEGEMLDEQGQDNITMINDASSKKKELSNEIWKEHLHWPKNEPSTKKKVTKRRMPFAISSKKWQDEQRKNEEVKNAKERIKKEKAEEKQRKRKALSTMSPGNERAQIKKKFDSNEDDAIESHSSPSNKDLESIPILSSPVVVGDYVVVIYDGVQFPGIVMNVRESEYEVNTMAKSGSNFWKWPTATDQIWYNKDMIKGKISPPSLINARGIYSFS